MNKVGQKVGQSSAQVARVVALANHPGVQWRDTQYVSVLVGITAVAESHYQARIMYTILVCQSGQVVVLFATSEPNLAPTKCRI